MNRMLAGVSTRRYASVGEPVGEEVERESRATGKSTVSELFVKRTRTALEELMGRRLEDVRLAVMMLDGIDIADRTHVVALGITTDGVKIPLGLWEGSTENATLARSLLSDLVDRGLDPEQAILFVIDGGLAPRIRASSRRYHLAVWGFPKPILAAVNGPAVGGGLDLCVLCDFRIASSSARFGHPEVKFGAPPLFTPLQWIVGLGVARELCLTGRLIDAAEGLRVGLVNRVVAPERLLDEALATARSIIDAPQAALEGTKRYLISSPSATFEQAFAVEHDWVFDQFFAGPLGPRATG